MKNIIKNTIYNHLNENNVLSYDDVINAQKIGNPYSDCIFSKKEDKFIIEEIHIERLRKLNGFSNDNNDELEQTISYFRDIGVDEDYFVSRELMNKLISGIKLNPIVVDENYKLLDGSHRLAAYSELWFYHGYDFPFDGVLKIYKRVFRNQKNF